MKLKKPLLVVTDMEKSVAFYRQVLGLRVVMDFGANKTLTGGLSLQTRESWESFIETDEIIFGGNSTEIYFVEDDFDAFLVRLAAHPVAYVHPVKEHPWGQRAVRIYDPDHHIIEIAEDLKAVCRRFLASGMTPEEVAQRMDVPMKVVRASMKSNT